MAEQMGDRLPIIIVEAFDYIQNQLEGYEGECAGAVLRGCLVCGISSFIFDEDGHVEVDQDEAVDAIAHFEHDVVDAEVAM